MDFTLRRYVKLMEGLVKGGYQIFRFDNYLGEKGLITSQNGKGLILRHDVDRLPGNALEMARLEHAMGVYGSYYFRIVLESFDPEIMREIAKMGHEVGYHYEDVDLAARILKKQKRKMERSPGASSANAIRFGEYIEKDGTQELDTPNYELFSLALELFEKHLEQFRKIVPVTTICMHGSPRSKYDNRSLWEYYDYRDYGIIGEPYFDVDFTKVLYLTDTGRRWDGKKYSVRDKEKKRKEGKSFLSEKYHFHSTDDIIRAAEAGGLPDQLMITVHPQRWTDQPVLWVKEWVWQNVKNQIKRFLIR